MPCRIPHAYWKTETFVGALRLEGVTVPTVLDGATHAAALLAYVKQLPVPTLELAIPSPCTICLLTNRPPSDRERRAELRFLPSYSPDFNPIEMAFAMVKAFLKQVAARTVDNLWDAIGHAVDILPPGECRTFYTTAEYE